MNQAAKNFRAGWRGVDLEFHPEPVGHGWNLGRMRLGTITRNGDPVGHLQGHNRAAGSTGLYEAVLTGRGIGKRGEWPQEALQLLAEDIAAAEVSD